MSYSKVRFPLLMGAMLAAALPAYSQQPSSSAPPANTPPAAASATPAPAAAPAQTSTPPAAQTTTSDSAPAKPSAETLKKAKSVGMTPEVRKGVTQYCWEDANTGTRFTSKKCVAEDQLDQTIAQREETKEYMRRMMTSGGGK